MFLPRCIFCDSKSFISQFSFPTGPHFNVSIFHFTSFPRYLFVLLSIDFIFIIHLLFHFTLNYRSLALPETPLVAALVASHTTPIQHCNIHVSNSSLGADFWGWTTLRRYMDDNCMINNSLALIQGRCLIRSLHCQLRGGAPLTFFIPNLCRILPFPLRSSQLRAPIFS